MSMTTYRGGGGGGGVTLHVDGDRLGTCRTPSCGRWPATYSDYCNNRKDSNLRHDAGALSATYYVH
jgi:hypothetical protein